MYVCDVVGSQYKGESLSGRGVNTIYTRTTINLLSRANAIHLDVVQLPP